MMASPCCPGDTIVLENERLRIEILPEVGAKIYSVQYKPTKHEILWRNPQIPPRRVQPGASYDDHWSGGWDEIFPNDEPAYPDSFNFPDHGELWRAAWQSEVHEDAHSTSAYLHMRCERARCLVQKWVTLCDSASEVRVRYRITNEGGRPVPYLFKLHPAMAISPGDRIVIPASRYVLEPSFPGTLGGAPQESNSPLLETGDGRVDLRIVPPPDRRELHFFYGTNLSAGYWQLFHTAGRLMITLSFPQSVFTSCWLFASYGGWNDYYVAVPEPCTGYPFRLEKAVMLGTAAELAGGATIDAEIVMTVQENEK